MLGFLVRRLLKAIVVLLEISTIRVYLLRLAGDPMALLVGPNATIAQINEIRRAMGFADPLTVQYTRFLGELVRLDFGQSIVSKRPAMPLVFEALPNTLIL